MSLIGALVLIVVAFVVGMSIGFTSCVFLVGKAAHDGIIHVPGLDDEEEGGED